MKKNNAEIKDVEVKLGEDGWLYYYGSKFEVIKSGDDEWSYRVYLNGKEIKNVVSVEFKLTVGEKPIVKMEVIEG